MKEHVVVVTRSAPPGADAADVLSLAELRQSLRRPWRALARDITLAVEDIDNIPRRMFVLTTLRIKARRRCRVIDERDRVVQVTVRELAREAVRTVTECIRGVRTLGALAWMTRSSARTTTVTSHGPRPTHSAQASKDDRSTVLYLRTFETRTDEVGGAATHAAGVITGLLRSGRDVVLMAPNPVVGDVAPSAGLSGVGFRATRPVRNIALLVQPNYDDEMVRAAPSLLRRHRPTLLYQRYTALSTAGIQLAQRLGIPAVIEFNGSVSWMARHWDRATRFGFIFDRVERYVLSHATLVVTVSDALGDTAIASGAVPERVVVIPNGVDLERFDPHERAPSLRSAWGFEEGDVVVTFVGTFGPWHGADVLADAFRLAVREHDRLRLLLVGAGAQSPIVAERLCVELSAGKAVMAGLVPSAEIAGYLAMSDILVAPTVANPDGSEFFGSPTKLFEYLAAGRAVVASAVGQVSAIVHDGDSGLLVKAGDAEDLAATLVRLARDPSLRLRLGAQARRQAELRHSWDGHVGEIQAALMKLGVRT